MSAVLFSGSSKIIGTPRIHVDGLVYRTDKGQLWRGFSMTGFRDYQKFLTDGPDAVRPLFQQAKDLGANMRRTFGMWGLDFQTNDGFGPFLPQRYGDRFYDAYPDFLALRADYGLYDEFCVFADTAYVMPDPDEQKRHYDRIGSKAAQRSNSFIELVNENDQHGNRVDIASFAPIPGVPCCSGSNGEGKNPTVPFWDYSNLHAERREDRMGITTSSVYYAQFGYKGENGEPDWPGTHQVTNNDEPGRTNDGYTGWQMGVGSQYGGWITSHTKSGTQSVLLNPDEAESTRQMFRGAQGLPFNG